MQNKQLIKKQQNNILKKVRIVGGVQDIEHLQLDGTQNFVMCRNRPHCLNV
jgi:hypothetical protein